MEKQVEGKFNMQEVDMLQRGLQLRMKEMQRAAMTGPVASHFEESFIERLFNKLANMRRKFVP